MQLLTSATAIPTSEHKMQLLTSATAIPTSEHKVPLPLNSVAFKRIHLKLSTPKSSGILDTKSTGDVKNSELGKMKSTPLGRNLKRPNSTAPEVNDTHLAVSSKTSKTLSTESNDKSLHRPIPSFKKRSNPKDPSRIPPFNASDDRKVAPPASSITPLPRDKKRMASSRDDPTTEQSEILNSKHHSPGSEGNAEPLQQHNLADKGGRPPRAPLSLKQPLLICAVQDPRKMIQIQSRVLVLELKGHARRLHPMCLALLLPKPMWMRNGAARR
ncbi:hypothetical protein BASA84_001497 [Batrachochytrium salamandrivorans]|nr:hypothetical protein BASA84_001497 [Batrachochytrium salamandrivorans]